MNKGEFGADEEEPLGDGDSQASIRTGSRPISGHDTSKIQKEVQAVLD